MRFKYDIVDSEDVSETFTIQVQSSMFKVSLVEAFGAENYYFCIKETSYYQLKNIVKTQVEASDSEKSMIKIPLDAVNKVLLDKNYGPSDQIHSSFETEIRRISTARKASNKPFDYVIDLNFVDQEHFFTGNDFTQAIYANSVTKYTIRGNPIYGGKIGQFCINECLFIAKNNQSSLKELIIRPSLLNQEIQKFLPIIKKMKQLEVLHINFTKLVDAIDFLSTLDEFDKLNSLTILFQNVTKAFRKVSKTNTKQLLSSKEVS